MIFMSKGRDQVAKYIDIRRPNDNPMRRCILAGFANLIDGELSADRAKAMFAIDDVKSILTKSDFKLWESLTRL